MPHCCGGNKSNITLNVRGMSCHHCEMAVKKAVGAIEGVKGVEVDIAGGRVIVETDGHVSRDSIAETIADLGYDVEG